MIFKSIASTINNNTSTILSQSIQLRWSTNTLNTANSLTLLVIVSITSIAYPKYWNAAGRAARPAVVHSHWAGSRAHHSSVSQVHSSSPKRRRFSPFSPSFTAHNFVATDERWMIFAFLAIRIFFCFRQTCCAESFLYHKKKLYIKPTYHKWTYTRLDWRFCLVLVPAALLLFSLIIRIIIVGNYQYRWCRRLYE